LLDRTDGGMLWWHGTERVDLARAWLRSPRVCGQIKIARYPRLDLYNTPWVGGAYHLQQIYEAAPQVFGGLPPWPTPALEERHLAKIGLGFGFWAFTACDRLAGSPCDFDATRGIDVFCAGSLEYSSPLLCFHRHRALEAVEQIPHVHAVVGRGRVLSHAGYCDLLRHSRICVSPWGWGETTIRDYEAMFAGCVLVKPRTDFIDSLVPLDERHYVPCAVDFSDLEDKVNQVLSRWEDYTDMRRANRERLLAARDSEQMTDHLAALIRGLLERAPYSPAACGAAENTTVARASHG
jgi:hypothetical protein